MAVTSATVPDRPRFTRKLTLATAGGEGLDGFDLGLISVALPLLIADFGLSSFQAGLLGASTLIGIFLGGPVVGSLADRFGRRRLFAIDIVAFVVIGLLQAVVVEFWQLLAVRVLLGAAIGAEYSLGAAMLAEFTSSKGRGRRLSGLLVSWYVGYLFAVVLAYAMTEGLGLSWRWALAVSVLPALGVLALRHGLPESPRWLVRHGRGDEARAVIDRHLGPSFYDEEDLAGEGGAEGEPLRAAHARRLLEPELRSRTIFVCVFWICQVTPYFAIFTFAPTVFASLDLSDVTASTIAVNALAAAGSAVGMLTIERIGRRTQLIWPFWITGVALGIVGIWTGAPAGVIVGCFAVFAFFNALSSNLDAVYPIEVFPTEMRSTGVGFATAASRVGAAAGTFLLPIGIDNLGITPCMLVGAVLCLIGGAVSQVLAPETTGQTLTATSAVAPAVAMAPASG